MILLSIETSCDETAIALVEATGDFPHATYRVLGNGLLSQIDIHREFGGVFPSVAKREHAKALVPMLHKALREAGHALERPVAAPMAPELRTELTTLLTREEGLAGLLIAFFESHEIPHIDAIAVTSGPGLEPALWVGVNFARALSMITGTPVIPVNHMEGHILSSVFQGDHLGALTFPALALLISGGHTEFILMKEFGVYEKIGSTRDDAVGEAFDKTARMLGLPYPGGPEISALAAPARAADAARLFPPLPRPMIKTPDFDFSFSGLKTAVRTRVLDKELTAEERAAVARDFEDSVTEVLMAKSLAALRSTGAHALILGGGVTANSHIRATFTATIAKEMPEVTLYIPDRSLSTDNAIMIALSGHAHLARKMNSPTELATLRAQGGMSLETN